jgi:hypothetical protein
LHCATEDCPGPGTPADLLVPDLVTLELSSAQQFELIIYGDELDVGWYVDGVRGGRPDIGMITQAGLYVAPPRVPAAHLVIVSARSAAAPGTEAAARAVVMGTDRTPHISIVPETVTAVVGDSVDLDCSTFGYETVDVVWSITSLSGDSSDIGHIDQEGTYVAPLAPRDNVTLMVIARSMARPEKSGIAKITVRKPLQFFVELEEYEENSGAGITRGITCGGGIGVSGLDAAGEWIRVPLVVEIGGRYLAYVRYAAADRDELGLTVTVTGCCGEGSSEQATFLLDKGSGVGG